MVIGIIGAMKDETRLLITSLSGRRTETVFGSEITTGVYAGHTVCVCTCGVGKVLAAAAALLLIERYGCEFLINTGIAGNTSKVLKIGDAVIADKLVFHDMDPVIMSHYYPYAAEFCPLEEHISLALDACEQNGVHAMRGTVASGDQFIDNEAIKRGIVERTGCACVEMEGAAVANIAAKCGVPFLCMRVMSDNADAETTEGLVDNTLDISAYCETSRAIIKTLLFEL